MIAISRQFDAAECRAVVDAIDHRAHTEPGVSRRSRHVLARAARAGRVVAARDGDRYVSWTLSEPCGPGVHELGLLYVERGYRDGDLLRTVVSQSLAPPLRAIVVTTNPRFSGWLVREHGFHVSTLWGVTRASRGMFLLRRLSPLRLREARRQLRRAHPIYLIREKVSR